MQDFSQTEVMEIINIGLTQKAKRAFHKWQKFFFKTETLELLGDLELALLLIKPWGCFYNNNNVFISSGLHF